MGEVVPTVSYAIAFAGKGKRIQRGTNCAISNHVDMQWNSVTDDANGSGMGLYQIYKDFSYLGNVNTPYSDTSVSPGNIYTYTLIAVRYNATTKRLDLVAGGAALVFENALLNTAPGLLYWNGGGYDFFNGGAEKYTLFFRAYTDWLPDSYFTSLCAELRTDFNAV